MIALRIEKKNAAPIIQEMATSAAWPGGATAKASERRDIGAEA
jgi:hypothetical protein